MGVALAEAVLRRGGVPIVVSGSAAIPYPAEVDVHSVETTEQMLHRCLELFPKCSGIIGAAAPCDFRPVAFSEQKISKSKDGNGITLRLSETPDILAALGKTKRPDQWSIAFALETENGETQSGQHRALEKLKQKNCDFVVLNGPDAIDKDEATFRIFDAAGEQHKAYTGSKRAFAEELLSVIIQHFVPNGINKWRNETFRGL